MISTDIHKTAYDALDEMELAPDYQSEEHDFQDAVVDALCAAFEVAGIEDASIVASIGGPGRPRIDLFGTNVWPDIEISVPGHDEIGIELKLVRENGSLPMGLKESIGQAFIYRLKYAKVIVFIVTYKRGDARLHDFDDALIEWCRQTGISFLLRPVDK